MTRVRCKVEFYNCAYCDSFEHKSFLGIFLCYTKGKVLFREMKDCRSADRKCFAGLLVSSAR